MDPHHLADDDVHGAALAVPGEDDGLDVLALQVDGRVRHPAGLHQLAFGLFQPGLFEFVHLRGKGGGGDVHGVPQGIGHDVVHEFPRGFDVYAGVLPLPCGAPVDGHQHVGGIEGQVGELAVGGQIIHPVGADGAEPADDPGHGAGFKGGPGQAMVVFRGLVEHSNTSIVLVFLYLSYPTASSPSREVLKAAISRSIIPYRK